MALQINIKGFSVMMGCKIQGRNDPEINRCRKTHMAIGSNRRLHSSASIPCPEPRPFIDMALKWTDLAQSIQSLTNMMS